MPCSFCFGVRQVAASSTRAPIYRTFAKQNNLADVTAKGGCARLLLGLALSDAGCRVVVGCPRSRATSQRRHAWHRRTLSARHAGLRRLSCHSQCDPCLRLPSAGESVANLADVVGTAAGIALAKLNLPVLPTFCLLSLGYLYSSRWGASAS